MLVCMSACMYVYVFIKGILWKKTQHPQKKNQKTPPKQNQKTLTWLHQHIPNMQKKNKKITTENNQTGNEKIDQKV